jgi:hypothetical protein
LAQTPESESVVEVIVGRFITRPDGNYMHCKNLRCLHLTYTGGGSTCAVELEPRNRVALGKIADKAPSLATFAPNSEFKLTPKERRTLQRWLAARYDRSAFPDEFDRRLKAETGVAEPLSKAFRESGKYIPGIFFDVDEGEERIRNGADDPYQLVITLLYATDEDPAIAEKAANAAKDRIQEIFNTRCRAKNDRGTTEWRWIELQAIEVVSDQALTYAQSCLLTKWHADYISLRTDPAQPIAQT